MSQRKVFKIIEKTFTINEVLVNTKAQFMWKIYYYVGALRFFQKLSNEVLIWARFSVRLLMFIYCTSKLYMVKDALHPGERIT